MPLCLRLKSTFFFTLNHGLKGHKVNCVNQIKIKENPFTCSQFYIDYNIWVDEFDLLIVFLAHSLKWTPAALHDTAGLFLHIWIYAVDIHENLIYFVERTNLFAVVIY